MSLVSKHNVIFYFVSLPQSVLNFGPDVIAVSLDPVHTWILLFVTER